MHLSTTFKAEIWGFLGPTLPLTWQTQGAQCGLGEDGVGPSRCLCRDVEMGGWTPESKARSCSWLRLSLPSPREPVLCLACPAWEQPRC